MSEVNFFELAEIAEASYANLLSSIDIQVEDALQDGRYLSKPFSETQAKQFTATWEVIDYQPNTESSGFSATLFRHKNSDEYVLGIRGTKGLVDLKEDVGNIVADGMAFDQALDLYNYWQKVTHLGNYQAAKLIEVQPPANLTPLQIKQWAHTNGYLFDITIDLQKVYAVEFETRSDGLGLIGESQQVHVTGHSLGGHLAAAFSRLFPANTLDVTMVNGAGFGEGAFYLDLPQTGSAAANMDVFNFFSALGCTVAFDAAKITNLVGTAGWDLTSQDSWIGLQQPGSVREIETENWTGTTGGHGAAQMTDTLAVLGMLYRLDNRLQLPELNQLLLSAGTDKARQLEDAVNAMARVFNVSLIPDGADNTNGGREDLYKTLKLISAQAGTKAYRVIDLNVSDVVSLAQHSEAVRFALLHLSSFAIEGAAYDVAELAMYDPQTGQGTLTKEWICDRAEMLSWLQQARAADSGLDAPVGLGSGSHLYFADKASGERVIVGEGFGDGLAQRILFDDDSGNTLTGGDKADRLYGMGGNDSLKGEEGNDYLEGGTGNDSLDGGTDNDTLVGMSGNDTLIGGKGNDSLCGGQGADQYEFSTGDGFDRITDSSEGNTLKLNGQLFPEGKQVALNTNAWASADGKVTYTLSEADSSGKQSLLISYGPNDHILIEGYHQGNFGLTLNDYQVSVAKKPDPGINPFIYNPGQNDLELGTAYYYRNGELREETYSLYWLYTLRSETINKRDDLGNSLDQSYLNDNAFIVNGWTGGVFFPFEGGNENDSLSGTDSADVFNGKGGSDYIDGKSYGDLLYGGGGDDYIVGGAGNDIILGDERYSNGSGYSGSMYVDGSEYIDGNDYIDGGDGNDFFSGGAGNDLILGGNDEDIIYGGSGEDKIFGDSGHDTVFGDGYLKALEEPVPLPDERGLSYRLQTDFSLDRSNYNDYIEGGEGNDWITGESGSDTIIGGVGDDRLIGDREQKSRYVNWLSNLELDYVELPLEMNGDDLICADAGNDIAIGGGGNDLIYGGADNDVLFGDIADGEDTLYVGHDVLFGDSGDDQVVGGGGDDYLNGGSGKDLLIAGVGNDTLEGGTEDDELQGGADNDVLYGGEGSDLLAGEAGNDTVYGDAGLDFIAGGAGNDSLSGGADNDQILGDSNLEEGLSSGDDSLYGDGGNDSLWGEGGNDRLFGGQGNDVLVGDSAESPLAEQGNDTLSGGDGHDDLQGQGGNDHLIGGEGSDYLSGGAGDDIYEFSVGDSYYGESIVDTEGVNSIEFGAGITSADLSFVQYSDGAIELNYSDDDSIYLSGGLVGSIKNIKFSDGSSFGLQEFYANYSKDNVYINSATPADNITGSAANNTLIGTGGFSVFRGGRGNDQLTGDGGGNVYCYDRGDGVDHIYDTNQHFLPDGSPAANKLQFGAGILPQDVTIAPGIDGTLRILIAGNPSGEIILHNFDSNDAANSSSIGLFGFADGSSLSYSHFLGNGFTLTGTVANDSLMGSNLADYLIGRSGNDTLTSCSGNDTLEGGIGDDSLIGAAGADIYLYSRGDGNDTIVEASDGSINILRFGQGISASDIQLSSVGSDLLLNVQGDSGSLVLKGWLVPGSTLLERVEFFDGSVLTGEWIRQQLRAVKGTTGNDRLFALPGESAVLIGLDGDDTLTGDSENDELFGDAGDDSLSGGYGSDHLEGGTGNDSLQGLYGDDFLDGGDGNDYINTGAGSDIVYAGGGDDNIYASSGAVVDTGAGDDWVTVQSGQVTVKYSAGSGADTLFDFCNIKFSDEFNQSSFSYLRSGAHLTILSKTEVSDSLTLWGFYYGSVQLESEKANYFSLDFLGQASVRDVAESSLNGVYLDARKISDDVYWRDVKYDDTSYSPNADKFGQYAHVSGGGYFLGDSEIGNDVLIGTSYDDYFTVRSGDDLVRGLGGDDTITIYNGNDTVEGGAGDDNILLHGSGYKTILYSRGDGHDTISTQVALVDLSINGYSVDELSFSRSGADAIISFGNEIDSIILVDFLNLQGGSFNNAFAIKLADGGDVSARHIFDAIFAAEASPVTSPDTIKGVSDSPLIVFGQELLNNDSDAETVVDYWRGLHVTATSNAVNGQVYFQSYSGNIIFIPDTDFTGLASFEYTVSDYLKSSQGRVDVYVEKSYDVVEGVPLVINSGELLRDDLKPENDGWQILSVSPLNGVSVGFDSITKNITVTAVAGYTGSGSFSFVVSDGVNTKTEIANVEVGSLLNQSISGAAYEDFLEGSFGNDTLSGAGSNDTLVARKGNDRLIGGTGIDTMLGGLGNDTYVVDNLDDLVIESGNAGVDSVEASISYTLGANIESLMLTGSSAINGTGNALDNALTGNSGANTLTGGAGNDRLDGKTGADTLIGGTGDDVYVVDSVSDQVQENSGEGLDRVESSVTFTLGGNVENLTLTGTSAINATGNVLANTLTGNSGANRLDGGAGADTMSGGSGNDTYVVDDALDVVVELSGQGTDTIEAASSYALGAEIENLTLVGNASVNGQGNALNNVLTGNSGANRLDGGSGNDTMRGGAGDDTYVVDSTSDTVTENAAEGTDTIESSVTFTLGSNLENLTLTGTTAINATGNAAANRLLGNAGNNRLDGGAGADTMTGGVGNDTYVVDDALDQIVELAAQGTDTVETVLSYTLGAELENLTLTGTASVNGTGNALNNVLTGNSGANRLDGGAGADSMIGGAGNDTYVVNDVGDSVSETSSTGGTDTVESSVSWTLGSNLENLTLTGSGNINATGNTLANTLRGNHGNNRLDGGAGNDTMIGGLGDDTYVVGATTDVVTENANEGIDSIESTVTLTLGNNLENLTLLGTSALNATGNTLNNILIGNSAINTLTGGAGNDRLDGKGGADKMLGGAGDDTYVVDLTTDVITENASEGTDTIESSVTLTLGNNVENLTLTGTAALNGTGNTLNNVLIGNSGSNSLAGAAGNDRLDGQAGADTLTGGVGNDTYVLGRGYGADTVVESDSTAGNTDVAQFLSGIATDQLWFTKALGTNNLEVSVIGTSDKLIIKDWYVGTANHVEQFKTSDGKTLLDSQVQNLVNAMSAFAPPAAGQTSLPSNYHAALDSVIAANWQ